MRNNVKLSTVMLIALLSLCSCNKKQEPVQPDDPVTPVTNPAIEVKDGRVQEKYDYTPLNPSFDNKNTAISRFVVYVETDFDTDLDGKNDLIKTFIQLPKEVLEKGYKVANIIQASPYTSGTYTEALEYLSIMSDDSVITIDEISGHGESRPKTDKVDTLEHANNCSTGEFLYNYKGANGYSEWDNCNYFIVRGFAYINFSGFGSLGSEGLQTQGTRLEVEAYKSVIEWLSGTRTAFTDKNGTNTIEATFSNGNSALQGTSYLGTTAYELACSNIPGLKTVCPTAGIASWYEYTNSQGTSTQPIQNTPWLSYYCASRTYEGDPVFLDTYGQYLKYMHDEEIKANGDYGEYWEDKDFTKNINISCPALIVHGVNDYNVKFKHGVYMYEQFKKANQNVKMVIHQGSHVSFASGQYAYSVDNYKESFYEVLNRWYSHYLYDVDNGIENYPEITYQSNLDGKFYQLDNYTDFVTESITLDNPSRTEVTSSDQKYMQSSFKDEQYSYGNKNNAIFDLGTVNEDKLIKGFSSLDIDLKTNNVGRDHLQVHAVLLDTSTSYFSTYGSYNFVASQSMYSDASFRVNKTEKGTYLYNAPTNAKVKAITSATFDLYNPGTSPHSGSAPRVELEADKTYHYKVRFEPTVYNLLKGHNLKLALYTFDPGTMGKLGEFGDAKAYQYKTIESLATVKAWATTNPYSYTIDMTNKPVLNLSL